LELCGEVNRLKQVTSRFIGQPKTGLSAWLHGSKISLVVLKEDKPRVTYIAGHLAVASLSAV
jgi:hypothetical protein